MTCTAFLPRLIPHPSGNPL